MNKLYLVIRGNTIASILGRRLTAASSHPGDSKNMGGDSGAWIGEMVFLQQFGQKEALRTMFKNRNQSADESNDEKQKTTSPSSSLDTKLKRAATEGKALYTIIAETDSDLIEWSFDDIEELMRKSTDLRGAMTRAMTAPIVGKVINFSVSRSTGRPNWTAWLDDWRSSGAKTVTTLHHYFLDNPHKDDHVLDEEEEMEDGDEDGFDFDHDDEDEGDEEVEEEILNRISDIIPIPSSR